MKAGELKLGRDNHKERKTESGIFMIFACVWMDIKFVISFNMSEEIGTIRHCILQGVASDIKKV